MGERVCPVGLVCWCQGRGQQAGQFTEQAAVVARHRQAVREGSFIPSTFCKHLAMPLCNVVCRSELPARVGCWKAALFAQCSLWLDHLVMPNCTWPSLVASIRACLIPVSKHNPLLVTCSVGCFWLCSCSLTAFVCCVWVAACAAGATVCEGVWCV